MKWIGTVGFVAAMASLATAPLAHAASQTILGRRMQIANPGDPVRRRVSVTGQERNSPNTVVGNPVASGASLTIISNGANSSSQTFSLPSAGWTAMTTGFRYSGSRVGGQVRSVSIKKLSNGTFQLRIVANGRNGALNVVPGDPTLTAGANLTLGSGDTYCISFGGASDGAVQRNDAHAYQARNAGGEGCLAGGGSGSSTTTTSTTTSTTIATCPAPPPVPLGSFKTTTKAASTNCGGLGITDPAPSPPFTGEVDLPDSTKRADLALGCLYVGDGAGNLPGSRLPDGGTTYLDVASINGTAFTLTASDGTGPATCSKKAGPGKTCLNGLGPCTTDADCDNTTGACVLTPNCYFGPPTPVALPVAATSNCILNAIQTDVCAEADLATMETSITSALLSAEVYITGSFSSPCPRCVSNQCVGGERDGLACSGGVGSEQTTIECPPLLRTYAGKLPINLSGLSTGTHTATPDANGKFCPGQHYAGAFTGDAGSIKETGVPLGGGMNLFDTTLAGTFCVPSSGTGLFDNTAGLPGPGAVSVPQQVSICLVPSVCSQLCSPCNLGPACAIVCAPCNMCS